MQNGISAVQDRLRDLTNAGRGTTAEAEFLRDELGDMRRALDGYKTAIKR